MELYKLSIKSLRDQEIMKIAELEEKELLLKTALSEKDTILQESHNILEDKQKEQAGLSRAHPG